MYFPTDIREELSLISLRVKKAAFLAMQFEVLRNVF